MSIANTQTENIVEAGIIEGNDQVQARIEHLKGLEKLVGNSYPNKFQRTSITGKEDTITDILAFESFREIVKELKHNTPEGEKPNPVIKEVLNAKLKEFGSVRVSGRMAVPPRVMGKAAFVHLSDGKERLQIYVRRQDALVISNDTLQAVEGEDAAWEVFKLLDHGDFIGAEGYLFLTNTGELSVHVEIFQFLSKSLLPMPDKMRGIGDAEIRQRQRYADLIGSSLQVEHEGLTTRQVFEVRAKTISSIRRFLEDNGYIEVETPMLTPKATGAAATPFETWHNALDIKLYARIAPELYLKRLTVGGFEKVYELNRNFRNEGISFKHNPEFTMLEFYCAYMDVNGMMDFCEKLLQESVQKATDGLKVNYEGNEIDFSKKFERISMKDSIVKCFENDQSDFPDGFRKEWLEDNIKVKALEIFTTSRKKEKNARVIVNDEHEAKTLDISDERSQIEMENRLQSGEVMAALQKSSHEERHFVWAHSLEILESTNISDEDAAKGLVTIFENVVEEKLIQPTFIIDYPKSISPLSKASPENPQIAERFEFFINGMEVANGFSELNDPQEQYERFVDQMKERERGDAEAMVLDEDYIRALAYGMPPAAGIGIGIDRLVMLLTNKHSIRDVILFPHLRPERKAQETENVE
jgi:lysyl-tRNA synthetase class 2